MLKIIQFISHIGYTLNMPRPIAKWWNIIAFTTLSNIYTFPGYLYSHLELYSRPITYRIIFYILRLRLYKRWCNQNQTYIIKRFFNIKYLRSKRQYHKRYKNNMQIVAQMSKDTGIPQHILLSQYKDLGKINLTYIK